MDPQIVADFAFFGLPHTANWAEVQAKYKELAHLYHPDRYPPGSEQRRMCEEFMKQLNSAHDRLEVWFAARAAGANSSQSGGPYASGFHQGYGPGAGNTAGSGGSGVNFTPAAGSSLHDMLADLLGSLGRGNGLAMVVMLISAFLPMYLMWHMFAPEDPGTREYLCAMNCDSRHSLITMSDMFGGGHSSSSRSEAALQACYDDCRPHQANWLPWALLGVAVCAFVAYSVFGKQIRDWWRKQSGSSASAGGGPGIPGNNPPAGGGTQ